MTGKLKIAGNMGKAMALEKMMVKMQKGRSYHTSTNNICKFYKFGYSHYLFVQIFIRGCMFCMGSSAKVGRKMWRREKNKSLKCLHFHLTDQRLLSEDREVTFNCVLSHSPKFYNNVCLTT